MAARQAFSHEALSETSTTTSGSWPGATTFSFTPDANFDYWIIFSCLFANGSGTAGHYGEVSVYHDQGSTSVGYWANRAQEISSPQDWFGVFCVHKSAFGASPGQQDYIVSINSSHAGDATKIKDIRFLAIKADAADKYAAVDASSQGTAGAGYATKTTLTFTPASTGDYLLIGSAVLTSEGASSTGARLNHSGGSIYGENLIYPKAAWLYNTWATAAKINLAASSQTFTLQFSPSASVACDIEQARILALRLDKFDNAYVAQDFAGGNSTSASDQDYLTLTQTPLNLSHAILAVGAFRTASTTVSGYLNVCKSGTNYTETIREGVNTAGYVHAGAAVKETLAASSTTWKWRARAETSGTAIHVDDLLIALLQLDASPTTVTASVSFDAAIQAARSVAASADAAVQKTISVQAVADAAVQKMLSGQTTVDAAVQKALLALLSADAVVQATVAAGASADAAVQVAGQLAVVLDAAVAALRSAQSQIDAVVSKAIAAGLGADAVVQRAFLASASLDAVAQALRTATVGLDAAVQTSASIGISADAYVVAAGAQQLSASLDAAVLAVLQANVALDAAVAATIQANVALDAAVQAAHTAVTIADAAIYARLGLAVDATAAVLATLAAGFTASAVVQRTVGVAFSCDAVVMRPATARPIVDLGGVARPMTALAGSLASTVPMRGIRAAMTFLIGKTARKP